ncbi:MAG: TonB family protein, partial [Candidatus Marinimicrobia bacterium]|nr:TonB family protein [Candidatus Neomarinimicrobiota bacterium]
MIAKHIPSLNMTMNGSIIVRFAFIASISTITIMFLVYPKAMMNRFELETYDYTSIEQIDIPQTQQQLDQLPVPTRPSVPIAAESEDIADDLTLDIFNFQEFDFANSPPPPPNNGPQVKFIPYDDPPMPIGGYGAIKKNIVYPDLAREAGIEGDIVVQFFVDKKGRVRETIVLRGVPNSGLNEAACDAIRKT